MLRERLIVILILLPIGVGLAALGGWFFAVFVAAILAVAAWEYGRLFMRGGYRPCRAILVAGVALLALTRHLWGAGDSVPVLVGLTLLAMGYHTVAYARGQNTAAFDFVITLGGYLYVGWLGGYLISLRNLPGGLYWALLVIGAIAIGDGFAYLFGHLLGRHKIAPNLSPGKTWEGYVGGIFGAAAGGALLGAVFGLMVPEITCRWGLIFGLILGVVAPLGDFGESMLKRQFGVKDSGRLLPGHGGLLDRLDSWFWAAPIGFYLILWLV
ncbi:MAG TPA: CDP-archaeol synthase [Anaerolineaceae bacterium]|jgi:phosphatidate cytidylyltransferase|nr:CDP-archaeol synthase [Anaerolineaceae bacterium]